MEKFFITSRDCGLGDTLCNLHATHFLAKKFGGCVVIDWRRLPYNNFSPCRFNLFHSIFKIPDEIENVKFYSYEEISGCHDLDILTKFPWIFPITTTEDIYKIVNENNYINVASRSGEYSHNFKELEGVQYVFDTYLQFYSNFEIKSIIKSKINFYLQKYFLNNDVICIHIRHGNGENRGGYTDPWYSYKDVTDKINNILNEEFPNGFNDKTFVICADNNRCAEELLNTYPNSYSTEKTYNDDGIGSFHATCKDPISNIQDAFIDMELMSYCKMGILTHHSVFNLSPSLKMKTVYYYNRDEYFKGK